MKSVGFNNLKHKITEECKTMQLTSGESLWFINTISKKIKHTTCDLYDIYISSDGCYEEWQYSSSFYVENYRGVKLFVTMLID